MTLPRCGLALTTAGLFLWMGWLMAVPVAEVGADEPAAEKKEAEKKEPKKEDADADKKATPKKVAMKLFMRKKLEASQSILEGLAVEDFDLIATGARQLKTTSAAAEFMVVRDPMYAQHADEFRRIAEKLEKSAKDKRLDGATLAYVDMTLSCVECHKYVRNVLIAKP